jgi:adenylosuccinate synthase
MKGWKKDISQVTNYEDLPEQLKAYIHRIEELIKTKMVILSVGPQRRQTIIREKIFE